jgi:hypothetical protein
MAARKPPPPPPQPQPAAVPPSPQAQAMATPSGGGSSPTQQHQHSPSQQHTALPLRTSSVAIPTILRRTEFDACRHGVRRLLMTNSWPRFTSSIYYRSACDAVKTQTLTHRPSHAHTTRSPQPKSGSALQLPGAVSPLILNVGASPTAQYLPSPSPTVNAASVSFNVGTAGPSPKRVNALFAARPSLTLQQQQHTSKPTHSPVLGPSSSPLLPPAAAAAGNSTPSLGAAAAPVVTVGVAAAAAKYRVRGVSVSEKKPVSSTTPLLLPQLSSSPPSPLPGSLPVALEMIPSLSPAAAAARADTVSIQELP